MRPSARSLANAFCTHEETAVLLHGSTGYFQILQHIAFACLMYILLYAFSFLQNIAGEESGVHRDDSAVTLEGVDFWIFSNQRFLDANLDIFAERKPSCHSGWAPFAASGASKYTHCLKVFATFRMSWQQAEESCTQFGNNAHLLSIQNADQIAWLTDLVSSSESRIRVPLSTLWKTSHWLSPGWWVGLGQVCPNHQIDQMPALR
ncbi:unnamed protein product [Gongylonema pulchrum]|uniref:C-type lectin domain-containing protein n=1 Tax=Gongylonema pulchrum TaxID=637853 RepID=A0A183DV76_9BILA|nr:unnamed protein product [Gongylonema pulchrum]